MIPRPLLLVLVLFPFIVSASFLVPISSSLAKHHKTVNNLKKKKKGGTPNDLSFLSCSVQILNHTQISVHLSKQLARDSVVSFLNSTTVLVYGDQL